jgi:hypothetical protein
VRSPKIVITYGFLNRLTLYVRKTIIILLLYSFILRHRHTAPQIYYATGPTISRELEGHVTPFLGIYMSFFSSLENLPSRFLLYSYIYILIYIFLYIYSYIYILILVIKALGNHVVLPPWSSYTL